MVVSLKANRKRIAAFLILAAVVVGACIFLLRGGEEEPVREYPGGTNEDRVSFLQSFGWQVREEPAETREGMIPAQFNDVYTTYNVMQKAQGFDLKPYAGETCTQYKYKIENYPNQDEVYATLLVRAELIIGGDVACSEVDGFMHGFAADSARYGETTRSESSAVESSSAPESSMASEADGTAGEGSNVNSAAGEASVVSAAPESTAGAAESAAVESTAGEPVPEEAYPTD